MRYTIGFMTVREGQKHSPDLFRTHSRTVACIWLKMGFRVWDGAQGRQIHAECQFY